MGRTNKQRFGLIRGMSSALVMSIAIHAAAFAFAAGFVVFKIVSRKEVEFVPPPAVERPKMKLRKPKVKVKKSNPRPTSRITVKTQRVNMPDLQLPEMSGGGDGFLDVGSDFDMMAGIDEITVFGSGQSIGCDFVGTFYDFKRDRTGRPNGIDPETFTDRVAEFIRTGWRTSTFSRYYRSPKKLYTTSFMVPPVSSSIAPSCFGEERTVGYCWLAHYTGKIVHKDGITFRFWGQGDDILTVTVDKKVVLAANWPSDDHLGTLVCPQWRSTAKNNRRFPMGNNASAIGDWITLEPGVAKDMEVVLGEIPGGQFCAMLCVEVQGEEYPLNSRGGPILPAFKTSPLSQDLIDTIYVDLVEGEASLTNGPVFRDF